MTTGYILGTKESEETVFQAIKEVGFEQSDPPKGLKKVEDFKDIHH